MHTTSLTLYHCDTCIESFDDKGDLERHKVVHSVKVEAIQEDVKEEYDFEDPLSFQEELNPEDLFFDNRSSNRKKLFTPFEIGESIFEQVNVTVTRYNNKYYIGLDDLDSIPENLRPNFKVADSKSLSAFISPKEQLKDRKLAWVWSQQDEVWFHAFQAKLLNGELSTLTKVRSEASVLYRLHNPNYIGNRATRMKGGAVKRSRLPDETNVEDNKRLAVKQYLEKDVNVDSTTGDSDQFVLDNNSKNINGDESLHSHFQADIKTEEIESENERQTKQNGYNNKIKLFNQFKAGVSLTEQVDISVKRYNNNYFIGVDDLDSIPLSLRPNIKVADKKSLSSFISSKEQLKQKKLAWVWSQDDAIWQQLFKAKLANGDFKSLTQVKEEAASLYRLHSPNYSGHRATKSKGGELIRNRLPSETNMEYRKRLAVQKIINPETILSFRDKVQSFLMMSNQEIKIQFEANQEEIIQMFGRFPETDEEILSDLIAFNVSKFGCN